MLFTETPTTHNCWDAQIYETVITKKMVQNMGVSLDHFEKKVASPIQYCSMGNLHNFYHLQ